MSNELTKLPLWEVLKSTFTFVWQHKKIILPVLPLVLILMVAQIIIRLSPNCIADLKACSETWQVAVLSIVFSLTNIAIVINYCRGACGKKSSDYSTWSFVKRLCLYVALLLGVSLFLVVPIAIIIALIAVLFNDILIAQTIFYISVIILGILIAPLLLMFPAIAMDDYASLSIQRLFRIAKGNHNAIFWGLALVSFLCFAPMFILVSVVIWFNGLEGVRENLWLILCGMGIQIIFSAVKGSYYAHIYQLFKYVKKNN